MKKYFAIIAVIAGIMLLLSGCKKFLDVNRDPNHPTTVSESLQLGPIEKTMAGNTVAGLCGFVAADWSQQISINLLPPSIETYEIFASDVDGTWSYNLYPATFQNLKVMIAQAEAAQHNEYAAIGKALYAFNLAVATDFWNDIPYSQANNLAYTKPKYDSQESIYNAIQSLLDSAIYYAGQPASAVPPSSDDFIYGGDMVKWTKLMYTLKARYYMRLTKAPSHTAAAQADSALAALQSGLASNDDNANISYVGSANDENPWYQGTLPSAGGVVMSKFFVDGLTGNNDPRLPVIANLNSSGTYTGRATGADPDPDYTIYSTIGSFFGGSLPLDPNNVSGASAPLIVCTYSEALFIKAEATFIKSGAIAAEPVYQSAIAADMALLGISASAQTAYLASRPILTAANAQQEIISEKYTADFLSIEAYDDWRRTGFPVFTIAQNAFVNYIPRRWPYPLSELLANPQPQQSATTADRVWWDAP